MPENPSLVRYSCCEGVATITFNRPDRLNAIDLGVAHAFARAVDAAANDGSARILVVSSTGRAFVAGGDLEYFRVAADKEAAARELIVILHDALKSLAQLPLITVGSLKGAVAGAGMSIALNLDFAIAAENTIFNMAYARIGASPDCGASWSLPRLIGLRRALEVALLSDSIGAIDALSLGLVNRVVALADLERETSNLVQRLLLGSKDAQMRTKRLMRTSQNRRFDEQLDAEAEDFITCAGSHHFSNAIDAFCRRPPLRKSDD